MEGLSIYKAKYIELKSYWMNMKRKNNKHSNINSDVTMIIDDSRQTCFLYDSNIVWRKNSHSI